MIKKGDRRKFMYPYYGTPDGYPEYTAHSGQTVEVLEELPREYGEKMFKIKSSDGWEGTSFSSELGRKIS